MRSLYRLAGWCALVFFLGCAAELALTQQDGVEPPPAPRESSKDRLARAIFLRHMRPVDRWLEYTGVEPVSSEYEHHYALVIEPEEPGRSPYVVIRFRLDYKNDHFLGHEWTDKEPWWSAEEGPLSYAHRIVWGVREDLRERLDLAFVHEYEGPMETFTTGVPVFLRMATGDSDPKKSKKEDVIYRN